MNNRKVLLIDVDVDMDADPYDCIGNDSINIKTKEMSMRELQDFILQDQEFLQRLEDAGWVNKKDVLDKNEKIALSKKFLFTYDRFGRYSVEEINLANISNYLIQKMAMDEGMLSQVITKDAFKKMLDAEQLKIYNQTLRNHKTRQKKERERKRQEREKKAQKELEKAKKLLQEAGEL